jgi:hypothetical protein
MFNKKSTAGFILVFSFLFLCRSLSYAQPRPVKETTYEVISSDYCCGSSVPDTTSYMAEMTSDNSSKDQSGQKSRVTFYRFYCKICCFLVPSEKQTLPEKDKVTDPALIRKLRVALKKQLEHNLKMVNGARY